MVVVGAAADNIQGRWAALMMEKSQKEGVLGHLGNWETDGKVN